MPSQRSEQNQTSTADDSPTQLVKQVQDSTVVADVAGLSNAATVGEQKRRRKKRQKSKLPPPDQRRMVQALGRIEGRISPAGSGIEIVTKDGAAFRVSALGKSGLALRLLGLSDCQRSGRFSFWPAYYREGIILVSFNNADDWQPQQNSPPVDQLFLCGTLQTLESERFSVLVGYGYRRKDERFERLLTVESQPLPSWTVGEWVDLILHRHGEVWRWQGEFHPRGPQVGDGFKSWLPYIEKTSAGDLQA